MSISNKELLNTYDALETVDETKLDREEFGVGFNFKQYTPRLKAIRTGLMLIKNFWDAIQVPENALDVYPIMMSAAEGETKQIILRQAGKSIFDTGSTGYLDGDKTPPPMNLNEIVNKMAEH